jgi:O-antigen/teichoic acid export membrane protein
MHWVCCQRNHQESEGVCVITTLSKKTSAYDPRALLKHQGFMRYFKNTSWMLSEQILRLVAGLFVGVWVARYLGPEQFGIFSYALAFTALFAGIAKLGLDGIVVRELVKTPERRDELLGTAFWLKIAGAIAAFAIIFLVSSLSSNDPSTHLYILIIAGGMLFQGFNVVEFYFRSKVLAKFVSICKLVQLLLSSIVKIYLVLTGKDLIWFVCVTLIDSVTIGLSLWVAYKYQKVNSFFGKFNPRIAKELLKDSWPIILSSLAVMIYLKIDQIMIKAMLGAEAVGQYAAAVRLSEVWYFIPTIICSSIFPAIISAKKQSEKSYYDRLQKLYDMMVWMALAIVVPMTFLSGWLVSVLYGDQYIQAGSILRIHIWASVFVFLGVASGQWFITENLQVLSFLRTFYGMIFNILLNFLLIPKYGAMGAALATLGSYFVAGFLFDLFNKKTIKVFYMKLNTVNPRRII